MLFLGDTRGPKSGTGGLHPLCKTRITCNTSGKPTARDECLSPIANAIASS